MQALHSKPVALTGRAVMALLLFSLSVQSVITLLYPGVTNIARFLGLASIVIALFIVIMGYQYIRGDLHGND